MMNMGVMATINQMIEQDTAVLVVEEMGHTAVLRKENIIEDDLQGETDSSLEVLPRPPVVTVMGTSITARHRCSTTYGAPRWRPARRAALRSISAPTTWKRPKEC